jgi:chromosome segregation ATPase
MKKVITVSLLAIAVFFSACQPQESDVDEAKDKVEDAKADLKTAQKEADSVAINAANEKEWIAFKAESDMKIKNAEAEIAALKEKMKKEGKAITSQYNNRIDSLEEKSRQLKKRIDGYSNSQTNWQEFKAEFNRDMEGLGQALKSFIVPAKK